MTRSLFVIFLLCLSLPASARPEKKRVFRTPSKVEFQKRKLLGQLHEHQNRLNCTLGVHVFDGSGLAVGQQLGFRLERFPRWYAGPEYFFALNGPSSLLSVMMSGWREFIVSNRRPGIGFTLGAAAGVGFARGLTKVKDNTYVAFLDMAVFQELDPFTQVRGQIRPGVVGGHFALLINFNVSFRL